MAECPKCGTTDEKLIENCPDWTFDCPKCGKTNICGAKYDYDLLICTDCAGKADKSKKKSEVSKRISTTKKTAADGGGAPAGEPDKHPFYIRKVKCPVCGTSGEQRWFQAKTYSERGIGIDKHVNSYAFVDKDFNDYHPPLYYMWHCFNCHWTDAYIDYENPMKDPFSNFRTLKDNFIDQYQDDPRVEKIVDKLGENIDYTKMNYYMAIKLHLLAVFVQNMIEDEEEKDALKIGRYFVRLGWLYRELEKAEEVKEKIAPTLEKLIEFLKKGWPDIPADEEEAMKQGIAALNLAFKTSHSIKSVVAEVDLLLWIGGIHLNLDHHEEGLRYMNLVLSRGAKTKQKLEMKIKEGEQSGKPADEIRKLDVQLKKLDSLMNKARDIISDIQAEKMKKEKAKAQKIMKKLGDRPPEEIREILIKKGIDKRVAIKLTPEPKKKFLGLF